METAVPAIPIADIPAASAYGAFHGITDPAYLAERWAATSEDVRADWRRIAEASVMGAVATGAAVLTAVQADVERGVQAVAARVRAEGAALVAEILDDFWGVERFEGISEGLQEAQARVDEYRRRAGLPLQPAARPEVARLAEQPPDVVVCETPPTGLDRPAERHFPGAAGWEEFEDGRLHVFSRKARRIATYAPGRWMSVREEQAAPDEEDADAAVPLEHVAHYGNPPAGVR